MATSGSTDFNLTRNEIIKAALRKCRAYDQGSEPTQEAIAEGAEALNVMVKAWQGRGVFLWTTEWVTKTFSSSDTSFSVASDTLGIQKAFYRDSSGDDTQIRIISFEEYNNIADKDSAGTMSVIAFDTQLTPKIYVWEPVDTFTDVLHYQRIRKLEDFDSSSDNPDFPEEWLEALIYGLAARLASEYGLPIHDRNELSSLGAGTFLSAFNNNQDADRNRMIWPAYSTSRRNA